MLRNLFFYPILCSLLYKSMMCYIDNKNKFKELFDSLEIVNIKIENINKFINRKKVMFEKSKVD